MKFLAGLLLLAVLQQAHDPQPCNRTGGGTHPEGGAIHACACHKRGYESGEGCEAAAEDRSCTAYCRKDWCECPVTCDLPYPEQTPEENMLHHGGHH